MPTAISTMRKELLKVNRMQADCISQSGYVISDRKYEYQTLCRKAKQIKEGIEYLEDIRYQSAIVR